MSLPSHAAYGKNEGIDTSNAPVAQLDRALDFESKGRGFESLRAHHLKSIISLLEYKVSLVTRDLYSRHFHLE